MGFNASDHRPLLPDKDHYATVLNGNRKKRFEMCRLLEVSFVDVISDAWE